MPDQEVAVVMTAIIFGGAFTVAIVAIVADSIRKAAQTRAKEQSRREIAAYVAEGSISPDDGVRMMEAGSVGWKNVKEMFKGKC